jgi:hypothetical protein
MSSRSLRDCSAWISFSIACVTSLSAGAPFAVENFSPLYSGGLCDAVKLIAPSSPRRIVSNAMHRRRNVAIADVRPEVVEGEHLRGLGGELLRQKARVVADENPAGLDALAVDEIDDALNGDADVLEREVLADHAPPPRGSELDLLDPRVGIRGCHD